MPIAVNAGFAVGARSAVDVRMTCDTVANFLSTYKANVRYQGLTVFITSEQKEYWFKNGMADADLVEKTSGGTTGGSSTLTDDLTFGVNVGGVTSGTTFPEGTDLEEVLQAVATVHATYEAPTLSISFSPAISGKEVGETVSPTIVPNWQQKDAGPATAYEVKQGGSTVSSGAAPANYVATGLVLTDSAIPFQATVTYDAGPVKNNSAGNPDPTGQIAAGSINSAVINATGVRKSFAGVSSSVPANSAAVRALTAITSPTAGSTFTVSTGGAVPFGSSVAFFYPATLPDVDTLQHVEASYADVKDVFSTTTVSVEGANGATAINYKGYVYTPPSTIPSTTTFQIKLKTS